MAKGKICRECGMPMYALEEEYDEHGNWVVYQCRKCTWSEKVFEKN